MIVFKDIKKGILITMSVFILFSLGGCGNKTAAKKEAKKVKVETVSVSSIASNVEYAAKLKALQEITITSKMSGKAASVKADVGMYVNKGDVLLTLDSKDASAQLDQAQANLSSAKSKLNTTGSSNEQQILQAQAVADNAKIQFNQAKEAYDRIAALYAKDFASKKDYDDVKAAMDSAEIQLNTSNTNLSLLMSKLAPQSVEAANTQVKAAQASVDVAANQLDNTTITSPIAGVVAIKNIEEGEMVSNSAPVFTILDNKIINGEIAVPDSLALKLSVGQEIEIVIQSLQDKKVSGIIDSISPSADSKTQLYTIKVKIDNADGTIRPGMIAKAVITSEKKDKVLVVPNEAITVESGVTYVYVVKDGIIKKTSVAIGLVDKNMTEITEKLSEGDNVVVEGQSFLNDGDSVAISK